MGAEQPVAYRRATGGRGDVAAYHELMWESVTDLGRRQGTPLEESATDW